MFISYYRTRKDGAKQTYPVPNIICSIIEQKFIEHVVYAIHSARHTGTVIAPRGTYILIEEVRKYVTVHVSLIPKTVEHNIAREL